MYIHISFVFAFLGSSNGHAPLPSLFAFLSLYMLTTAGRNARVNQPFYHCVPSKSQRSFLKCFRGNNYVKSGVKNETKAAQVQNLVEKA